MFKKNRILLTVILCVCILISARPAAVFAEKPGLLLDKVSLSGNTISKGDTFTASFVVRNNSLMNLRNIYLQIPSTDFSIKAKGSSVLVAEQLKPNESLAMSLELECHDTVSNRIPLQFSYENPFNETIIVNEQLLVTFQEIKTQPCDPSFLITQGDIRSVGVGVTDTIEIAVKNTSEFTAENVTITPVLSENMIPSLLLNQVTMIPESVSMEPGSSMTFQFSVTVNRTAVPGIVPVTYQLQCENKEHAKVTAALNGYIKITESKTYSDILINNTVLSPKEITREQPMVITVELENSYEQKLKNLQVWIEGLPAESFRFEENKQKKTPVEIDSRTMTAAFEYMIGKEAAEGNYSYDVHVSYTDALGNSMENKESFLLNLPPQEQKQGILEVEKVIVPADKISAQEEFLVSLKLRNTGEADLEDLEAMFLGNTQIMANGSSSKYLGKLEAGASKTVEFTLTAAKQTETASVPVTVQLRYDALAGEEVGIKTLDQTMGILLKGCKETVSQPKIIMDNIQTPEKIVNGEAFDIKFTVKNTSSKITVSNLKMTVSSSNSAAQGSDIIILGQSNSIYIAELGCGEEAEEGIEVIIPDSFQGNVCDLSFAFSYENPDGTAYTDQAMIHLPVTQLTELTASNVRVGNVRNDGYTLELDFYNTGKGPLENLVVDLEGDFEAANSIYYVGDLQSGRMDIYSVAINGDIPEKMIGNVLFKYEDTSGTQNEVRVPFELTYTAPAVETAVPAAAERKAFPYAFALVAICGLAAIIIIRVILKKKKAAL